MAWKQPCLVRWACYLQVQVGIDESYWWLQEEYMAIFGHRNAIVCIGVQWHQPFKINNITVSYEGLNNIQADKIVYL